MSRRATPGLLAVAMGMACSACGSSGTPTASNPQQPPQQPPPSASVRTCANPPGSWIFCDDFESNRLASYFEYDSASGRFRRDSGVGRSGSWGMRATYAPGVSNSGHLALAMGATAYAYFKPVDAGTAKYRDLYWRFYIRLQSGWTGGGGDKMTRIAVMANSSWAEAAVGHVYSVAQGTGNALELDPASGTDTAGVLQTTSYNDFAHFRWLGLTKGTDQIFATANAGAWHCIEVHARLNDAGQSNGIEEMWIDSTLDARVANMNFLGAYNAFGWNMVVLENFWNSGSTVTEVRDWDDFVLATTRVGC